MKFGSLENRNAAIDEDSHLHEIAGDERRKRERRSFGHATFETDPIDRVEMGFLSVRHGPNRNHLDFLPGKKDRQTT
jgi:hypothetical protein